MLDPAERRLSLDGKPVPLGARAFDLLVVLVERAGRLVSKNELLTLVWSGLVVEENNLQVQISALRKLLGPGALATIPGRGYRFELPLEGVATSLAQRESSSAPPTPVPQSVGVPTNLPARMPSLYGRESDLDALASLLERHAVVTVAGPGGIGKTRLAQAVAANLACTMAADFADGVWWVELAPVSEPALVPGTVARTMSLELGTQANASAALATLLAGKRLLLVLDNGEHVVGAVAELVDVLRANVPGLRILVTSQETLKVAEEHVFRLGALEVPAAGRSPQETLTGAVALFVARGQAVDPRFELTADNADAVIDVCRRLDGIPLAIELAAARLPLLGVEGLRARLNERFNLLTAGSRVVLRRHQTLRATVEWSYSLLSAEQQTVFRRLGVFTGSFTLQAAQAVVGDGAIDRWAALDHLGALVDKSLVLAEGEGEPRYRLLETARAYAVERLAEAGETRATIRRHAEVLLRTLKAFFAEDAAAMPTPAQLHAAGLEVDNLRAALMLAHEDPALALALFAHSWRVWNGAWLIGEGFERGLELRRCLCETTPQDERARFWLALANLGLYSNRRDAYEAALRAAEEFGELGDDASRFDALVKAATMGIRFCPVDEMARMVAEAESLVTDRATPIQRTRLEFVRHRLFWRLGRFDDALEAAWRQSSIARESGNLLGANYAMSNISAAEAQLGRFEDALAHARQGIAELEALDASGGAGHCWLCAATALAMMDRAQEALAACRTAYDLLLREQDQRRVLVTLAMCAALDGRAADAIRMLGYKDAADAREGVFQDNWTRARDKLEELLKHVPADERARLRAEGAAMAESEVVQRVLGDTRPRR
ncbi:MAG: winged helix-turn-helix domain-containing protein [Burkholderiales bacterium]